MIDLFLKGQRNPHFTGRSSILRDLKERLADGPVLLLGPDGMGKSAIAEEYGRIHFSEYDHRLWVRAWDGAVLASDYASLAEPLGIPSEEDGDVSDLAGSIRAHLEENGRWLLVFDGAPFPEALDGFLPEGGGDVVVTSRIPGWRGWSALKVGPLDLQEAADLLLKRTESEDASGAAALAEELDRHPLSLELAAAYLRWTGASISRYLESLRRRFAGAPARKPHDFPEPLAAVLEISVEQVGAVSQEGSDLLTLSAFLAPEDLPVDLLEKTAALLPESVEPGLRALERRGLVRRGEELLSVHPLVQAFAFSRLDEAERKDWAAETVRAVGGAFSSYLEDLSTWPECRRLLPSALFSTRRVEEVGGGSEEASLLLSQVGLYLHRRGDLRGSKGVLETLIVIDERLHGPDHPELATDLNNLGSVLRALGDLPGARRSFERAIAIEESQPTPDRLKIAIRENNLGTVLRALGDLPAAVASFERALAIDREAYGPNHFKTAIRLNNLGEVLQEMGDLEGARDSYQRAYRVFSQILGPGHHYTRRAEENLASLREEGSG
jgi:tetratricopeptide (TPR) repeat protein